MDLSTGFVTYVSEQSTSGSQNSFTHNRKVSNCMRFPAGWLCAVVSMARQRKTLKWERKSLVTRYKCIISAVWVGPLIDVL